MKLYIKYDINTACKKILQEQMARLDINYLMLAFGEIEIKNDVPADTIKQLNAGLSNYGIEVVENHKSILVQKIKDAIKEMVYLEDELPSSKISAHLAGKFNHSYGYLSNLFSEITYSSIEKFIILQKIERAKELIALDELNFTEITWKLNYSSVAHFSSQFKNATGLTPTAFKRIINRRRNALLNNTQE